MKTKTIFNFLAFAMLMAAMVLTTACSGSDDIAVNKPETTEPIAKKGYPLQVTVNVTRQGDDATRASYDENTGILSFSEGDQLFVAGYNWNTIGNYAGTLTWQSGGTFSGTITTQNPYSGTADELFSETDITAVVLLPNGYESYGFFSIEGDGCDSYLNYDYTKAFANSKAAAVAQFSYEKTLSYDNGFALHPQNVILNFTIYNLTANATNVAISFTGINQVNISKTVTADADGKATFAVGVDGYTNLNQYALTVGGNTIYLGSHELAAGHIYNITRYANTISGKFTVNASGDKVYFSKSNLQAKATYVSSTQTTWEWHFADTQYARVGTGANVYINGDGKVSSEGNGLNVDLFGWSTASTYLGINNSTDNGTYSGSFVDWGSHADVIAGIGSGWRTLTSNEWRYLLETRSGNRFAMASINGSRGGIVLLPDDWNTSYYSLKDINDKSKAFTNNTITAADWTSKLEAHGAVFLPVTGHREGTSVSYSDERLYYWSSTSASDTNANQMYCFVGTLAPDAGGGRHWSNAVRLVCDVK